MAVEVFDTHCHLTSKELSPACDRVIGDAQAAGVSRMITVACRADEAGIALSLRERHECVWISAGIHPHEAARVNEDEIQKLAAIWREPGVVAAGEMGLDYHYDFSPRAEQQAVFEQQLELARDTGLPVVIHCREAQTDVIRILVQHGFAGRRVVFHCFSGRADEAAEIRSHGWWASFTGLITFKNAAPQQQAMLETPLDQLMFETDAPYLSPEPVRKMRPNEPQNVIHTIRFAAMLQGRKFEDLVAITTSNARAFFNLQ